MNTNMLDAHTDNVVVVVAAHPPPSSGEEGEKMTTEEAPVALLGGDSTTTTEEGVAAAVPPPSPQADEEGAAATVATAAEDEIVDDSSTRTSSAAATTAVLADAAAVATVVAAPVVGGGGPRIAVELVYRVGRSNSLPDVGASARSLAASVVEVGDDAETMSPAHFVPFVLRRICKPRVTVFALLERGLGQTFSLDNGLAVQTVLEYWQRRLFIVFCFAHSGGQQRPRVLRLARLRSPKRSRAPTKSASKRPSSSKKVAPLVTRDGAQEEEAEEDDDSPASDTSGAENALAGLIALRRERQPRAVYWEARVVRIATWPMERRAELLAVCRALLVHLTAPRGADGSPLCAGEGHHRIGAIEEACPACVHRVLMDLVDNYSPPGARPAWGKGWKKVTTSEK